VPSSEGIPLSKFRKQSWRASNNSANPT
jgi:hypothetical protein